MTIAAPDAAEPPRAIGPERPPPGAGKTSSGIALLAPSALLIVFFFAALLWLFQHSIEPYAPTGQTAEPGFTLTHYAKALSEALYVQSLWVTFKLSAIATVFALLLGYPLAYQMVRTNSARMRTFLILTIAIPFLTNLIVRLYALTLVLGNTGLINKFAIWSGLMTENEILPLVRNDLGVGIGLTYFVLPFVVFTLAAALRRLDTTLEEAAMSLGANKVVTFFKVTLPLSMPGVIGAATLSFILSASAFATPLILGEGSVAMIANTIYDQVLFVENIPFGAALAVIALVITILLLYLQGRLTRKRYGA